MNFQRFIHFSVIQNRMAVMTQGREDKGLYTTDPGKLLLVEDEQKNLLIPQKGLEKILNRVNRQVTVCSTGFGEMILAGSPSNLHYKTCFYSCRSIGVRNS